MIPFLIVLTGLAWLGFFPPARVETFHPLNAIAAAVALVVYGWGPGYALLRLLPGDEGRDSRLHRRFAAPFAFGMVVATTVTIVTALAGLSFAAAVRAPVVLAAALLLVPRRESAAKAGRTGSDAPGQHSAAAPSRQDAEGRGTLLLASLGMVLVAALYLVNPWLRWRADGRFHIGVVGEILRGGLPPNDPFFSGLDLQYMWFYHAGMAALRSLSGAATPTLMALVNIATIGAFAVLLVRLSRGFGRNRGEAIAAAVLVIFAMGGLGWIYLPVKMAAAFTGEVRGFDEIRGIFNLWPPMIARSLAFFALSMDQPFLLRKFLVGTAMSLALPVLVLHLEMSRRILFGGGWGTLLVATIAAGGAVVLHPMMGIPAVAVVCGAAVCLALWDRMAPFPERVSTGALLRVIAAGAGGALLSLPYLLLVTHGKEGASGFPVGFLPIKLVALAAGSIGVAIPAAIWIRSVFRAGRVSRDDAWALLWAFLMTGFAAFVRFPLEADNIDKPALLVHLPLALLGGWAVARGLAGAWRRRVLLYLVMLLVPANLVILTGYALEGDPRTYRPHEKEAFRFINRTAEPEALVFDSQDRDRPAVEIQRRQYWSHEQFATTHEYPVAEMNARRALRDALYSEGGPGPDAVARLRALPAPVYVIVRAGAAVPGAGFPPGTGPVDGSFAGGAGDPLAGVPGFERVFDTDDVRVYRVEGGG